MTPETIPPDPRLNVRPEMKWKIRIDKETFDKLKNEESFWQIVALSRAVNSLRFVQTVLEPYQGDDSPAASLVKYNSFFFICALLYEASNIVQHFGKHHRDLKAYRWMMEIINTPEAVDLRKTNLGEIRNKLVFHFDYDEIGNQLAKLELDDPVFVIGKGANHEHKHVYLELADRCVRNAFAGFAVSETDKDIQRMNDLMKQARDLAQEFMFRADDFIVTVLYSSGWEFVIT
jgi:hypothetical protein